MAAIAGRNTIGTLCFASGIGLLRVNAAPECGAAKMHPGIWLFNPR